jgi:hypothetical protein
MSDFVEKLRLKGQAEEDIYFARQERELIAALRARRSLVLRKVISGGQAGVDRGALEAALGLPASAGISVGGWCPRGRAAEDGVIDARFSLSETPNRDPAQRTAWNVRDADATLILSQGELTGGTALTAEIAEQLEKPLLVIDLRKPVPIAHVLSWMRRAAVRVLNIAGPRESQAPGITKDARDFVGRLLAAAVRVIERTDDPQ